MTANACLSSGDLGDFASFVTHMKKIAEVAGWLNQLKNPLLTRVSPGLGEGC